MKIYITDYGSFFLKKKKTLGPGGAAAAGHFSFAKACGASPDPQAPGALPGRRSALRSGRRRNSPGDLRDCQLNRLLQKWKRSRRRRQGEIFRQKSQTKGEKGGQRENKPKWLTKRLKESRAQPLMKQRKPSLINTTPHPTRGPSPFLYNPDGYFYQLFYKCELFDSSKNAFFKKERILPHSTF